MSATDAKDVWPLAGRPVNPKTLLSKAPPPRYQRSWPEVRSSQWRSLRSIPGFVRLVNKLNEAVGRVHGVVEGQAGVDARGGQDLEEGVVLGVGGIVVAGGAPPSAAEPWLGGNAGEAVAAFEGSSAGALGQRAPVAVLQRTPEDKVECAGTGGLGGDEVAAIRAEADVLVVGGADGEGTVVGLGDAGAAIVIADAEGARDDATVGGGAGEGRGIACRR